MQGSDLAHIFADLHTTVSLLTEQVAALSRRVADLENHIAHPHAVQPNPEVLAPLQEGVFNASLPTRRDDGLPLPSVGWDAAVVAGGGLSVPLDVVGNQVCGANQVPVYRPPTMAQCIHHPVFCIEPRPPQLGQMGGAAAPAVPVAVAPPSTFGLTQIQDRKRQKLSGTCDPDLHLAPTKKRLQDGSKCSECGTTESPKWRCGNTLCNRCGLRRIASERGSHAGSERRPGEQASTAALTYYGD